MRGQRRLARQPWKVPNVTRACALAPLLCLLAASAAAQDGFAVPEGCTGLFTAGTGGCTVFHAVSCKASGTYVLTTMNPEGFLVQTALPDGTTLSIEQGPPGALRLFEQADWPHDPFDAARVRAEGADSSSYLLTEPGTEAYRQYEATFRLSGVTRELNDTALDLVAVAGLITAGEHAYDTRLIETAGDMLLVPGFPLAIWTSHRARLQGTEAWTKNDAPVTRLILSGEPGFMTLGPSDQGCEVTYP